MNIKQLNLTDFSTLYLLWKEHLYFYPENEEKFENMFKFNPEFVLDLIDENHKII